MSTIKFQTDWRCTSEVTLLTNTHDTISDVSFVADANERAYVVCAISVLRAVLVTVSAFVDICNGRLAGIQWHQHGPVKSVTWIQCGEVIITTLQRDVCGKACLIRDIDRDRDRASVDSGYMELVGYRRSIISVLYG